MPSSSSISLFKPMLAASNRKRQDFPVLASYKYDGYRCLTDGAHARSRNLKPIRNPLVQSVIAELPYLDGELIVGSPTDPNVWALTSAGVTSKTAEPTFVYYVFDWWGDLHMPYEDRLARAAEIVDKYSHLPIQLVDHRNLRTADDLLSYEQEAVDLGYEGVMLRDPNGPYKTGRSTPVEGWLTKVKRFETREARVIGHKLLRVNNNAQTIDALGHAKRSKVSANMIEQATIGALTAVDSENGVEFSIGSGLNDVLRDQLFAEKDTLYGRTFTYSCQGITPDGVPRFPVFKGWRHEDDM